MAEAARIGLATTADFLRTHKQIRLVRFVLFGRAALQTHQKVLQQLKAQ
jgi:O-acetyl-ADP-ribose deacetylase (regulator of RNase III)